MVSLIARSVLHLHTEEIVPYRRTVNYECRRTRGNGHEASSSLGRFYELMSVALYSGRRTNYRRVSKDELMVLVKPDIVDVNEKNMREVKGNERNHEPLLMDFQMEGYARLLDEHSDFDGVFEIYRHEKGKIQSFIGTEEELFGELCKKTQYGLRIPFSVAFRLWKNTNRSGKAAVSRYDGDGSLTERFNHCTRVKNKTVSNLLRYPESVLRSLRMNPNRFDIVRLLSPERFYFGRTQVTQFPILEIREK